MSSKMPWVSWRYSGPLPNTPQNSPISECTIWPPISGSESTSTTSRCSRADSMAADRPGDPGADHAHVGADLVGGFGRGPGDLGELELRQGVRH